MRKGDKITRWIIVLLLISTIVAAAEGAIYYSEHIKEGGFYIALIAENCVHTFTNDANITISDAIKALGDAPGKIQFFVCVAYCVAILVAPACTLAAIYRVLATLLKIRFDLFELNRKDEITIFGYNENVRALLKMELSSANLKKRKIRIVSNEQLSEEDEKLFYACQAVHYELDMFDVSEKEMKKYLKTVKVKGTKNIILYDECSTKNFSLFYAFYNNIQSFHEQVKFYCYCEDEEIHDILEDYYNGLKDKPDLELFSINELRVRKVYEEVPLHSYYFDKKHGMVKDVLVEDWNLHMVVVGLGKLGQRMILQAMTQGVVHSKSDMIFDVIDCNIEEQKEIFANHFSSLCMDMSKENEWQLGSPHADGRLIIRFHNMDARRKSFQSLLMDIGKDLPPTYIAVCITDEKNSLHCMLEVEKYLHRQGLVHVPVGVRMENDVRMSEFLISNNQKHKNVFVIEDIKNAISLDDMLSQSLNCAAKNNHYLYKKLNMVCNPQHEMVVEDVEYISNKLMLTESEMETGWRALPLFKRDSNRASSLHLNVKRDILDAYKGIEKDRDVFFEELWDKYFGKNGKIRKQGTQWVFKGTNEELNQYITKDVLLNEMAMMEHRRWCYFMASIGWKSKYEQSIREEESKIHPCLVDWKELLTNEELCENCKYDLQSLLFILNQWKEQKEMQKQ